MESDSRGSWNPTCSSSHPEPLESDATTPLEQKKLPTWLLLFGKNGA